MSFPFLQLNPDEIERHGRWLRRLALELAGDEHAADDLVQETWLAVGRRPRSTVREVRAYLGGVLRRRASKRRESDERRTRRERAEALVSPPTPAADLGEARELHRLLAEEIAALGPEERRVLHLRYVEGWTSTRISSETGVPDGTVRAQLKRTRERLRERLERRCGPTWAAFLGPASSPVGKGLGLAGGAIVGHGVKLWIGGLVVAACAGLWAWRWAQPLPDDARSTAPPLASSTTDSPAPPQDDGQDAAARLVAERSSVDPVAASGTVAIDPESTRKTLRLVDRARREPVPFAEVLLDSGERLRTVVADERGEVRVPQWCRGPGARAECDEFGVALDLEDSESEARAEWEVEAGPTYFLEFARGSLGVDRTWYAELVAGEPSPRRFEPSTLLRTAATRTFVRFTRQDVAEDRFGNGPRTLRVHAEDGCGQGSAIVERLAGFDPRPVGIELFEEGSVLCTVTAGGSSFEFAATVELRPVPEDLASAGLRSSSVPFERADRPRTVRFGHLAPGEYEATLIAANHDLVQAPLSVRAGRVTTVELDLRPRTELRSFEVELTSRSRSIGLYGVDVRARKVGWPESRFLEGRPVRAFGPSLVKAFENLEPGLYDVWAESAVLPPFAPASVRTEAGSERLQFVCQDDGADSLESLRVEVVDAETEQSLVTANVTHLHAATPIVRMPCSDGFASLFPIRRDVPTEVFATSPGHRPQRVLVPPLASRPEGTPLRIELEHGWGTMLCLRTTTQESPAGVEVLLDDHPAGVVGEDGTVLLTQDARPERLSLRSDRWQVQYGDIGKDGAVPLDLPFVVWIVLEPRS